MAYRDELEATRTRLADAEATSRELQEELRRERAGSARRIAHLEASLRIAKQVGSRRLARVVGFLGAAATFVGYAVAFLFATHQAEAGAWKLANIAIAMGVALPGWSWGRAGRLWQWLGALLFKVGVLSRWGAGWWSPVESGLRHVSSSLGRWDAQFYFFWWAPVFVFVTTLVEGFFIKRILDPHD